MSAATKLPPLPPPEDPRFLLAVYERLAVHSGQRGLPIDRMVTFRDLVESGIAKPVPGGGGAQVGADGIVQPASGLPSLTVPPPVTGLQANGAFTRVILQWSKPAYSNHAYVEVARAGVPDVGVAVVVGSSVANNYVDVVGGGFTGHWWARNVSTAGVKGPWSAPVTATTPASHDEILDAITSTEWQADTAYGIFNPISPTSEVEVGGAVIRLVAVGAGTSGATEPDWATEIAAIGDTVLDGSVTWQAVEAGKIPFMIDPVSGLVVIEGAAIRAASIEALQVKDGFFDTMTAAKGTLSEANISIANIFNALIDNYIQSSNYSLGSAGWRISANGDAEFNNLILRGIFQNLSGDRYIDMRPGATEGDFVLGDVGGQNYVSFKYEPQFGGRILRIRGDVALRNYEPGPIILHENLGQQVAESLPYMGVYPTSGSLSSMPLLKSTMVTRAGTIRFTWQAQDENRVGPEMFGNTINGYVLCLRKQGGFLSQVARYHMGDYNSSSPEYIGDSWFEFVNDIAVLPGEEIQVRAFSYSYLIGAAGVTPRARCKNNRLSIGFYPEETSIQ